jgi:hypothetical protein
MRRCPMRILCACLFASLFAFYVHGDSSSEQQAMQAAYQQFVQVDEQIENLLKQKLQLKAEAAQHMERGSTGVLPGVGRRQSREVEGIMQQIQSLSQQITELEEKRGTILLGLS